MTIKSCNRNPPRNEPTLDSIGSAIRTSLGSSTEGIRPGPAVALLVASDDTTCGWIEIMREDNRAIIRAASQASKAAASPV